jgi:hypothetical protein
MTSSVSTSAAFAPVIEFYDSANSLLFTSNIASTSSSYFIQPLASIISTAYTALGEDKLNLNLFDYEDSSPSHINNSIYGTPI